MRFCLTLLALWMVACTAAPPTPVPTMPLPTPTALPPTPLPSPTVPAPTATAPASLLFDGTRALELAQAQCDIGPRPAGSAALLETRDWIERTLAAEGWTVIRQDGTFQGVPIHNVVGVKGTGDARMVGAHFDTRPVADQDPTHPEQPIIGANDGASGVAVLWNWRAPSSCRRAPRCNSPSLMRKIGAIWKGGPLAWGARQLAEGLDALSLARPEAMVVLDMIGDADLQIFREQNSNAALNDELFGIAEGLGFGNAGFYNEDKWTIIDDHLPFIEQNIPAADLIDFDYPYWHTVEDTCDKLSADSLYKVGRVMELWLER